MRASTFCFHTWCQSICLIFQRSSALQDTCAEQVPDCLEHCAAACSLPTPPHQSTRPITIYHTPGPAHISSARRAGCAAPAEPLVPLRRRRGRAARARGGLPRGAAGHVARGRAAAHGPPAHRGAGDHQPAERAAHQARAQPPAGPHVPAPRAPRPLPACRWTRQLRRRLLSRRSRSA